jgi:hypothetical protein
MDGTLDFFPAAVKRPVIRIVSHGFQSAPHYGALFAINN